MKSLKFLSKLLRTPREESGSRYQSLLLKPYPVVPKRSLVLIAKRTAKTTSLVLAVGMFLISVHQQWWPDALGLPLYWMYDALYLRLKGYLYYARFPFSLTYLWAILVVGVPALWFYMIDRSLLRQGHIWVLAKFSDMLARKYTANPEMDPQKNQILGKFLSGARFLKRYDLPPAMMAAMAERNRRLALNDLLHRSVDENARSSCDHLLAFTGLSIRLALLEPYTKREFVAALNNWQVAYLVVSSKRCDSELRALHVRALERLLVLLIQKRPQRGPLPPLNEEKPVTGFGLDILLRDMKALADLDLKRPSGRDKKIARSGVILSHFARVAQLRQEITKAENRLKGDVPEETEEHSNFLGEDAKGFLPGAFGLAGGVALALARMKKDPPLVYRYLESMEALHLLAVGGLIQLPPQIRPVELLPSGDFWRMTAHDYQRFLKRKTAQWLPGKDPDSPLREHHFELERRRVGGLFQAAEPSARSSPQRKRLFVKKRSP